MSRLHFWAYSAIGLYMSVATAQTTIPDSAREAAEQARELLDAGGEENVGKAVEMLEAVMAAQDTRPDSARRGNFAWVRALGYVTDLNSVEFTLRNLIPMMIDHKNKLPEDIRTRMRECIRLGLEEVQRLDVALTYTNIATMDCVNQVLGGEYLEDPEITRQGRDRFRAFCAITLGNGIIYEFNSVNYIHVVLFALRSLEDYTKDEETRVLAKAMISRISASLALHIHPRLGCLTGPYTRVPSDVAFGVEEPYLDTVREWIEEGTLPRWVERFLGKTPLPTVFTETSYKDWDMGSTSYMVPEYAMGTAIREVSRQSGVFAAQYSLGELGSMGVLTSRYLLNDTFFEEAPAGKEGSSRPFLSEFGQSYNVQQENRAICLYAPRILEYPESFAPSSRDTFHSMKLALIWRPRKAVEGIWINDAQVHELPAAVKAGDVVVVAVGEVYTAIRPLTFMDLDAGAPMRLIEKNDYLVLEMYNYLGPDKVMWNLERNSRFFQGDPRGGFYAEMALRRDWPDGAAFGAEVARGKLLDEVGAALTSYMNDGKERRWKASYERDGIELGIEIELMQWELKRRWTQDGDIGWPMLESTVARHNAEGRVEIGGGVLTCGKHPAWLISAPGGGFWQAGYMGEPAPLKLETPEGCVALDAMGAGLITLEDGAVRIEGVGISGTPRIEGLKMAKP